MFPENSLAHWLQSMTALPVTTTREELAEQLRESFRGEGDEPILLANCCGRAARHEQREEEDEEEFPYLGRHRSPLFFEQRCKSSPMMPLGEKLALDTSSVGTSSTLEESIVSSGVDGSCHTSSSGVIVRRLGRMEVPKQRRKRGRVPRRRVCLVEGCHCPYHERSGPIDVDSVQCCEDDMLRMIEASSSAHNNMVNDELLHSSFHEEPRISVTRRDDSESSSTSYSAVKNTSALDARADGSSNTSDSSTPEDESVILPRFSDNPADLFRAPLDEDSYRDEDFVLDETDMSRGLVGYQDGCEPEVIAKFSDSDVQRWELEDLEKDAMNDNTLELLEREEQTSPSRSSRQSSTAHHSRQSKTSTTYPTTIPASAAEV